MFLFSLLLSLPLLAYTLSSPHAQLLSLVEEGHIDLNVTTFKLLTASDRTWGATVVFTALDDRYQCNPCKEFDPYFKNVAKSWSTVKKSKGRDNFFFATLDIEHGAEIFKTVSIYSLHIFIL